MNTARKPGALGHFMPFWGNFVPQTAFARAQLFPWIKPYQLCAILENTNAAEGTKNPPNGLIANQAGIYMSIRCLEASPRPASTRSPQVPFSSIIR
ncbi:hypothetical protein COO20_06795 [Thalassospira marina]|uniref:Uncharacterized protein n=1 Tax=Thalassospira marina TaxID=2048283 RepID=A0A2N3KX49_9PROT|nr:hypothetical protein COO20_06795 [Thalassospira marina]